MFACGRVVFLVVVTFLRTVQASTDAAPCVAMETCLLPCRFSPGGDLVVHWYQEKTKHNVHSFYHDRNQLGAQDPSFRGRTALFQDQISRGNASLRLTGVTIQDQGLYKCYTGTNERTMEVFNHLQVNEKRRTILRRRSRTTRTKERRRQMKGPASPLRLEDTFTQDGLIYCTESMTLKATFTQQHSEPRLVTWVLSV
uniref:Ig-like domain-containing protein n=1 Tax=Gasterosteus aculeatus aculeatus TaxID=481459 RepID=A0AAQ4PV35_GASAC